MQTGRATSEAPPQHLQPSEPGLERAIFLYTDAQLVPDSVLTPPFQEEARGSMRDLAALLLDRHLRRLARMRNPVEWRLARLLLRLDEASGYLDLGFARLQDYAAERLGLPARRVQGLVKLARRLRDLPLTAAAFEAGRLSESQVRVLLRVVSAATEAAWIEKASALNVRLLEREVRVALAAADALAAPDALTAADSAAAPHEAPAPRPMPDAGGEPPVDDDDAEEEGEVVGVVVPARLRARWDQALELARRSSGAPDPVWRCAEFIAADYLAGVPDLAGLLARSLADDPAEPDFSDDAADPAGAAEPPRASVQTFAGDGAQAASGPGAQAPADPDTEARDTDLFEEVLRGFEEEAGSRSWAPPVEGLAVVLPGSLVDDPADTPRRLDARLAECVRLRQSLCWHQGRLLRVFAGRRLYRELGFLSFSRYCRERAGLGVRRAWQLIALERRLWLLPDIARAYRSGSLSWVKAAAIARVAEERTEGDWLHLARSVTVRRLLDEVSVAQAEADRWWDAQCAPASLASSGVGAPTVRRRPPGPPGPPRPPGLDADGRVQLFAPTLRRAATDSGIRAESEARSGSESRAEPGAPAASVAPAVDPPAVAYPEAWSAIRFWAPVEVASLWRQALRVCRAHASEEARAAQEARTSQEHAPPDMQARELADWECLERLLDSFFAAWSVRGGPAWQRRYRIFERDGWRCRVPGCSARRNLQVHHVVFRSQGGGDDDGNLAVLCAAHHLQGIHRGRLRCHALPGGLLAWELGVDPGGNDAARGPLARYVEDVTWDEARSRVS